MRTKAPTNLELGIRDREGDQRNRAWTLPPGIAMPDPRMMLSLRLMQEFGLRVEEALKMRPMVADRLGMTLALKGSWTKGGRPRDIPIRTLSQLALLGEAQKLVGNDSMIPTGDTFIRHRRRLEHETLKRGLTNLHGLRYGYAQRRYRDLTGWNCPKAGGPDPKTFTVEQQARDKVAARRSRRSSAMPASPSP